MFVICITVILLFSFAGCGSSRNTWRLVWQEKFNQKEHFDETRWSKIPRGTSDWNNYMSSYDSLFAMRDGNMILRGMINPGLPGDSAPYITGGIYTKGKIGFYDGRLEIRARLHGARGAWPAFWLLPEGERWPYGGEIDIMERLNNDAIAYQTIHSQYTEILKIFDTPHHGSSGAINPDDYNIYGVEMYHDSLVLFINDLRVLTYPRIQTDKVGQFPFADKPFYLLLDMQLGGSWVGKVEPADLPVEMEIDWVRFYKKRR